jgi:hypothetical protein
MPHKDSNRYHWGRVEKKKSALNTMSTKLRAFKKWNSNDLLKSYFNLNLNFLNNDIFFFRKLNAKYVNQVIIK